VNDAVVVILSVTSTTLLALSALVVVEYRRLPEGSRRTRLERTHLWPAIFAGLVGLGVIIGAFVAGVGCP
jgi:hypothetical protein